MKFKSSKLCSQGFTLIETLVVLVVASIIMIFIISAFESESQSHIMQQEIVFMQQNLRGAIYHMGREIRMAGYNPTESSDAGIMDAGPSKLRFSMDTKDGEDNNDNGRVDESGEGIGDGTIDDNERVAFGFSTANDEDEDGIADAGIAPLGRALDSGGGFQRIAVNLHAVGLAYAYDADLDGSLDLSPNGHVIWAIDTNDDGGLDRGLDTNDDGAINLADSSDGETLDGVSLGPITVSRIRAVKIWLLARSERFFPTYNETTRYVVGNKVITPSRNHKHMLVSEVVQCRNAGL